jgi:hypothetical protein
MPNLATVADLHTLIPELFVCAAAFGLLMVDLFLAPQRRGLTHFLTWRWCRLTRSTDCSCATLPAMY